MDGMEGWMGCLFACDSTYLAEIISNEKIKN